jgi:hypothetical protein
MIEAIAALLVVYVVQLAVLGVAGYLCACAGRGRWLTFKEWW